MSPGSSSSVEPDQVLVVAFGALGEGAHGPSVRAVELVVTVDVDDRAVGIALAEARKCCRDCLTDSDIARQDQHVYIAWIERLDEGSTVVAVELHVNVREKLNTHALRHSGS
jgi:hypothetical protein